MSDDEKRVDESSSPRKVPEAEHIKPANRLRRRQGMFAFPMMTPEARRNWEEGRAIFLSAEQHKQVLRASKARLHTLKPASVEATEESKETDAAPAAAGLAQADEEWTSAPAAPPPIGEAMIGLFCKRELKEAVLGDLDERFAELAERRGPRAAKAWYWSQAARSVLFFAFRWGRRLLELEAILRRIL